MQVEAGLRGWVALQGCWERQLQGWSGEHLGLQTWKGAVAPVGGAWGWGAGGLAQGSLVAGWAGGGWGCQGGVQGLVVPGREGGGLMAGGWWAWGPAARGWGAQGWATAG